MKKFLWPNAIDQSQFKTNETGLREIRSPRLAAAEAKRMTDEQLALQAVRDAQQILEEYLEPKFNLQRLRPTRRRCQALSEKARMGTDTG